MYRGWGGRVVLEVGAGVKMIEGQTGAKPSPM